MFTANFFEFERILELLYYSGSNKKSRKIVRNIFHKYLETLKRFRYQFLHTNLNLSCIIEIIFFNNTFSERSYTKRNYINMCVCAFLCPSHQIFTNVLTYKWFERNIYSLYTVNIKYTVEGQTAKRASCINSHY